MSVRVVAGPSRKPELHVAALPFPSYQGTQAAIRSMLEAREAYRGGAELFTYATAGYDWTPEFRLHRGPAGRRLSLRSGPSWSKVSADLRMGAALPALLRRSQPEVIIAHHVEAMSLACGVPCFPRVFFAHTDLAAELPSYAAPHFATALGLAGATLDQLLCRRADAVAAISPALCARLQAATGVAARYVPTPWCVPELARPAERARARLALGLSKDTTVALYAGNLDAYQAAEHALEALHQLASHGGPRVTLLLATSSEPQRFLARAVALGVPFRSHELAGEPVRRMVHAAADLAIVPRAVPGGLPIKLLDALARGLPCAIAPLATAGLPLARRALCAQGPGPASLALAISQLAANPGLRRALSERARSYVASEHSSQRFNRALDEVVARAHERRARRSNHRWLHTNARGSQPTRSTRRPSSVDEPPDPGRRPSG